MSPRTIIVTVVLLASCSSPSSRASWITESMERAFTGTVVFEDGPIRLVDVTEPTFDCAQLVVGDIATVCPTIGPGSSMGPMSLRSGSTEVVWIAAGRERADDVIRFVVFSSASPDGRALDGVDVADTTHLVWRLQPNEEPWGVQLLGPSGELRSAAGIDALPD